MQGINKMFDVYFVVNKNLNSSLKHSSNEKESINISISKMSDSLSMIAEDIIDDPNCASLLN